jgi:hypothetical protein
MGHGMENITYVAEQGRFPAPQLKMEQSEVWINFIFKDFVKDKKNAR